jgi:hypothetical protein
MSTATCELTSKEGEVPPERRVTLLGSGVLRTTMVRMVSSEVPFSGSMRDNSGFARRRPLRPSTTKVSGSLIKCFAGVSFEQLDSTRHLEYPMFHCLVPVDGVGLSTVGSADLHFPEVATAGDIPSHEIAISNNQSHAQR